MKSVQHRPGGHELCLTGPSALQLPSYSTQKLAKSLAKLSHHILLQKACYSFPTGTCMSQTLQGPGWQPHSSILQAWPWGILVQAHHGRPNAAHAHRQPAAVSASCGGTTVLPAVTVSSPRPHRQPQQKLARGKFFRGTSPLDTRTGQGTRANWRALVSMQ